MSTFMGSDALAAPWRLGRVRSGRVTSWPVLRDNETARMQLSRFDKPQAVKIICEPQAYGVERRGRKTVLLRVDDEEAGHIRQVEEIVKNLLRSHCPDVDDTWQSALTSDSAGENCLRAKVITEGLYTVQVQNEQGLDIPPPASWAGRQILSLVKVDAYQHGSSTGLLLELVYAQLREEADKPMYDFK